MKAVRARGRARGRHRGGGLSVALSALLAGCAAGDGGDAAARLDDRTLPADRLSELLVLGQPMPLDAELARGLARHWVEMTALAQAAAAGDSLLEGEAMEDVLWIEVRQLRAESLLERRTPREPPSPAAVDSAYDAGELRLFAHVLRAVSRGAHPEERQRQREAAAALREELGRGAPWEEAVARSEDPETRGARGLLGVVARGELDPALEEAAFRLRPGELSGVVETPRGYHLVYRPRLEDVRPLFAAGLAERRARAAADRYRRGLVEAAGLRVEPDAPDAVRTLAARPADGLDSDRPLATWRDGVLRGSTAARYLLALPDDVREAEARAPDARASALVEELAGREILVAEAGDIPPGDPRLEELRDEYRDRVRELRDAAAVTPSALAAAGDDPEVRRREAAARVDRYMEAVVARRTQLLPVPPALAAHLLAGRAWAVSDAGIERALERAGRLLAESGHPSAAQSDPSGP